MKIVSKLKAGFLPRSVAGAIGSPLVLAGLVLSLSACSKMADVEPNQLGYDFYPLESGRFAIYDLTDITYSLTAPADTHAYQLKEVVKESFPDLAGTTSYRIERYTREEPDQPWEIDSVWTSRQTPNQVVTNENSVPFVKMIFPLRENQKWNGNAFNNLEEDEYVMKKIDKAYSVGASKFDQTVTVVQGSDSSLVNQDKRTEVYAKSVGLIYKEKIIVQFCSSSDCLGQGRVDFGVKQIQQIVDHGKE